MHYSKSLWTTHEALQGPSMRGKKMPLLVVRVKLVSAMKSCHIINMAWNKHHTFGKGPRTKRGFWTLRLRRKEIKWPWRMQLSYPLHILHSYTPRASCVTTTTVPDWAHFESTKWCSTAVFFASTPRFPLDPTALRPTCRRGSRWHGCGRNSWSWKAKTRNLWCLRWIVGRFPWSPSPEKRSRTAVRAAEASMDCLTAIVRKENRRNGGKWRHCNGV